jgi:hypothetical protein
VRQQRYYVYCWLFYFRHKLLGELNNFSCIQVYLNGLGLLLRLFIRGHIDSAKERLTTLLDALKNEVLTPRNILEYVWCIYNKAAY